MREILIGLGLVAGAAFLGRRQVRFGAPPRRHTRRIQQPCRVCGTETHADAYIRDTRDESRVVMCQRCAMKIDAATLTPSQMRARWEEPLPCPKCAEMPWACECPGKPKI